MPPTSAGQRLKEVGVMSASMSALQSVLAAISAPYGKTPVPVAMNAGDWGQREIARQRGGNVVYPYLEISLQQFSKNRNNYNENLRRRGINAPPQENSNLVKRYRLVPVLLNFRVRYNTQDFADMISWGERWLNRDYDVKFKLAFDNMDIFFKVILGEDINVPDPVNSETATVLYTMETSCSMESYIGDVEMMSKAVKLVFNANLISNTDATYGPAVDNPDRAVTFGLVNNELEVIPSG